MPTGYTDDVRTGKITRFEDFALRCARAFGALIEMRDDPMDAEIPNKFEPYTGSRDRIEEAKARVAKLATISFEDAQQQRDDEYSKRVVEHREREQTKAEQRARYEAMLEQVNQWEPPTADHAGLKKFMREQLVESINWDCSPSNHPALISVDDWIAEQKSRAERDVEFYEESWQKEKERTENKNEWVRRLRESLSDRVPA